MSRCHGNKAVDTNNTQEKHIFITDCEVCVWCTADIYERKRFRHPYLKEKKLTGLQIPNFHRQLERRDVIRGHNPLCAAAASVLHAESRDRRAAVGSRDPGDISRTFSRHGDGGTIGGLGHWDRDKYGVKHLVPAVISAASELQSP